MNTRTYHGIKVYNGILEQLKHIHNTEQDSLNEVRHYAKEFPKEVDFNLAEYGNLLVYYVKVREFYKECEYPRLDELDDSDLWGMYKKDVGCVAKDVVTNSVSVLYERRMYHVQVDMPSVSPENVVDWILSHNEHSKYLDHTFFGRAVVSLAKGNAELSDVLPYDNEPTIYNDAEILHSEYVRGLYALRVDGNVYIYTE